MENHCLKCNKYTEVNSFGYCKKCYKKIFKLSKHTTVEQKKIHKHLINFFIVFLVICSSILIIIFRYNILNFATSIFGTNSDSHLLENPDSDTVISSYTPLESRIIDADNYVQILDEYSAKYPDTDNYYYLFYSVYHYVTTEGAKYAQENPDDKNAAYQSIFGKNINQLISLGKYMMEENKITIDEFKNTISNFNK